MSIQGCLRGLLKGATRIGPGDLLTVISRDSSGRIIEYKKIHKTTFFAVIEIGSKHPTTGSYTDKAVTAIHREER